MLLFFVCIYGIIIYNLVSSSFGGYSRAGNLEGDDEKKKRFHGGFLLEGNSYSYQVINQSRRTINNILSNTLCNRVKIMWVKAVSME